MNDIYIEKKKICGILTEAVSDFESGRVQAVIIGIGINLTTADFPYELTDIADSVGIALNRCSLAAEIFNRMKRTCQLLPDRGFMDKYREYSLVLGNEISFVRNGTEYTAVAEAIHDDGSLEVTVKNGEKMILNSGEISVKLK